MLLWFTMLLKVFFNSSTLRLRKFFFFLNKERFWWNRSITLQIMAVRKTFEGDNTVVCKFPQGIYYHSQRDGANTFNTCSFKTTVTAIIKAQSQWITYPMGTQISLALSLKSYKGIHFYYFYKICLNSVQ